jgi:excisionase family DNA binding protein
MRQVFTTGQVARMLNVHARTVSKWFDAGRLRGYRVPGSQDRRIPREALVAFLTDHGIGLPPDLTGPAEGWAGIPEVKGLAAAEVLRAAREGNPGGRYAVSRDGNAVGEWDTGRERFVMVLSRALTGEWVWTGGRELLINGSPPYADGDWRE